jgi:hypothetical protein
MPLGAVMYGCHICNYGLCVECFPNSEYYWWEFDWSEADDEEFKAIPGYEKLYKPRKRGRFTPKRKNTRRHQSKKKDRSAERKRKREQKQRTKARRRSRLHKYRYHNDFAERHDSPTITAKVPSNQRDANARVAKDSHREEGQKKTSPVALKVKPEKSAMQLFHRLHTQEWIQFKYERHYYLTRTDIFALLESFDFLDLLPWICAHIGEYAETSIPLYDPPVEIPPFWSAHEVFNVSTSGKRFRETISFSMPAIFEKRRFEITTLGEPLRFDICGELTCQGVPVQIGCTRTSVRMVPLVELADKKYKNAPGTIFDWYLSTFLFETQKPGWIS